MVRSPDDDVILGAPRGSDSEDMHISSDNEELSGNVFEDDEADMEIAVDPVGAEGRPLSGKKNSVLSAIKYVRNFFSI
jgi:hypothetical protein